MTEVIQAFKGEIADNERLESKRSGFDELAIFIQAFRIKFHVRKSNTMDSGA
jgi:hypothetical protein